MHYELKASIFRTVGHLRGESPFTVGFASQESIMRNFDVLTGTDLDLDIRALYMHQSRNWVSIGSDNGLSPVRRQAIQLDP